MMTEEITDSPDKVVSLQLTQNRLRSSYGPYKHTRDGGYDLYRKTDSGIARKKKTPWYQKLLVKRTGNKKIQRAKKGTGKDANNKRIYTAEQSARKKMKRQLDKAKQHAQPASNHAMNIWMTHSRDEQNRFARDVVKIDESFINDTSDDNFLPFYCYLKVSHFVI
jgi:formate dehydrogenase maturation protein FdhE